MAAARLESPETESKMTDTRRLEPVIQCIALSKIFQDFWGRDKGARGR